MKHIIQRVTSLLLCAMLLLQMVPAVSVHVHAEESAVFTRASVDKGLAEGTTYLLIVPAESAAAGKAYYTMDENGEVQDLAPYYDTVSDSFVLSIDSAQLAGLTYGPLNNGSGNLGLSYADGMALDVDGNGIQAVNPVTVTGSNVRWKAGDNEEGNFAFDVNGGSTYYLNALVETDTSDVIFASETEQGQGYRLYALCTHADVVMEEGTPATCVDKGVVYSVQCLDCGVSFPYEEVVELPATGHKFVNGVCEYCDSEDYVYAPITSYPQLYALDEGTEYILVADVDGALYTMGLPPAEMTDSYPGIAYDLLEVTPEEDGTISANGLDAARFQMISTDFGSAIKLPNYWLKSTSDATEPWVEACYVDEEPPVEKTGGWYLAFYDPTADFNGGVTEMTYAEYFESRNSALAANLEAGSILVYNTQGDVSGAMRLRDFENPNGKRFYIAMGEHTPEEGATDQQYPLYLYAAFDHVHQISGEVEAVNGENHAAVCSVSGCSYATDHEEHTFSDSWIYVDANQHAQVCTVCGYQQTSRHRAEYTDNGNGTHSVVCAECAPLGEAAPHQWGEWSYNANMRLHVRTCQQCFAEESSPLHLWGNAETLRSANCVNAGIASTSCMADGCQATKEWEIAALGHDLTPWYTVNEVSETRHGKEIRYCLVCGESETRITPMEGHVHNMTPVEADEYYGTIGYYYCSEQTPTETTAGCGGKYLDEAGTQQVTDFDLRIKPCEHDWGDGWQEIAATAEASGCWERVCTLCGEIEQVAVPATGHVHEMYRVEATEPSCILPGNEEHYVCAAEPLYDDSGMQIGYQGYWDAAGENPVGTGDAQIPTVAHPDFEWVVQDEYDHERECAICGYVQSGSHFYSGYADNGVDADTCQRICLACGYVEKPSQMEGHEISSYTDCGDGEHHQSTCSFCKTTFTMPHNWSVEWTGDVADHKCVEYGCNYSIGEEHIWVLSEDGYTAPSCSAPGSQVYTCICGKTTSETIPEEEHVDEDGDFYCDVCKANLCGDDHPDADNDYYCDQCKVNLCFDKHVDEDTDYYCDYCNTNLCFDKHPDENNDYYCDQCNTNLCFDQHEAEVVPGKEASCTETGLTEGSVCKNCKLELVAQEELPMTDHPDTDQDYVCDVCKANLCFGEHEAEAVPGKEASCTETGLTEGSICKNCGQILVAQEEIPMTDHPDTDADYYCDVCKVNLCFDKHEAVAVPGKEASCTETGLTEGSICKNCKLELVAQEEIPVTAHPDTDQDYVCDVCKANLCFGEHEAEAVPGKEASCTETGLTEGSICKNCGQILVAQEEIPMTDHPDTDADYYCDVCKVNLCFDKHEAVAVPGKEASCTETGLTEGSICKNCKLELVAQEEIPMTNHRTEVIPAQAATCIATGLTEGSKCTVCNKILVEQQVTEKLPHSIVWTEGVVPTCTKDGYTAETCCDVCGVHFTESTTMPATGPRWSEWLTMKEPTQLQNGKQYRYCLDSCGEVDFRDVPAYGHVHHLVRVAGYDATCSEAGILPHYICVPDVQLLAEEEDGDATYDDSCGCMFVDGEDDTLVQVTENDLRIPATGKHEMGDWVKLDSNLMHVDQYQRVCLKGEVCGYSEIRNEPKEGHEHRMVAVNAAAPTCEMNGTVAHFACADCRCLYADENGEKRLESKDVVILTTGHEYGKHAYKDSVYHDQICERCGDVKTSRHHYTTGMSYVAPNEEEIQKELSCVILCLLCDNRIAVRNHQYSDVEACDDRWQHQQTCSRCAFALVEDHEFGDWVYGEYEQVVKIEEDGTETTETVLGHYRSCHCGARETSLEHIWDEGTELEGHMTYSCIVSGCDGVKEEFLRCIHTCLTCGKCTAEATCPDQEACDCAEPETLVTTDPDFLHNNIEDPNETYLGDVLVKEEDEQLDPDAKPGQEIPEKYAKLTVGIQEVPLIDEKTGEDLENPYTDYVKQALTGYSAQHLFDIHLLDSNKNITESPGNAQYLIRLCLDKEIVLGLQKGLLRLAHITEKGTFFYGVVEDRSPSDGAVEDCIPFYKLEDDLAWFWADSFSPFALVEPQAPYYGREALAKMDNKDALLYAYDQIVAGVETCQEKIQIYPAGGTPSVSIPELQMVMDAYTRDHTEHFWLEGKYSISYKKALNMATAVKPTYSMKDDELAAARAEFEAAADAILHGITDEMSEFDRQLLVHDRLAAIVEYDKTLEKPHVHDAYGALVNHLAVCQGYAEALQYLLRRVGIQSFVVTGYSQDQSHAWNQVQIDNEYYHTDLTWNDQGDELYHAYFNMSDPYITEDHSIYLTAYPMDACQQMESNYFKVKKADLTDAEARSVQSVAQKLKGSVNGMSFLLTENTTALEFLYWFIDHQDEIFAEAGLQNVKMKQEDTYTYLGREAMIHYVAENGEPPHICGQGTTVTLVTGQAATCTAAGWKDYYLCSCDKLYAEQSCQTEITNLAAWKMGAGILTAAHSFGDPVPAQPVIHNDSQMQNGVAAHYRCTVCDQYFTESKAVTTLNSLTTKPEHTFGGWVSTDAAKHWKACSVCGKKDAEGAHTYSGTTCTTCGHVKEAVAPPPPGISSPAVDSGSGKVTLTLAVNGTATGKVMVAVYDTAGRMLGISYVDETITIDSTGRNFTVVYDKNGTPRQIKAFLMDTKFAPSIAFDPQLLP